MRRLALLIRFALPALLMLLVVEARAIEIVQIEEFWELQVGEPDGLSSSPQVSMVMSHTGDLLSDYFVFTVNHHSHPEFAPGGMQVQRWNADEAVAVHAGPSENTLDHTEETLRWVQRMTLDDGLLTFEIDNGTSDSWGSFGGEGYLRLVLGVDAVNLNNYRPAVSIEQSGVSYAGNRVRSLTLTRLRWTDTAGQVYELIAPIDVDADLDP
ncbi:MAG: hypothetical protein KDA44_07880 [Planctomycetales bacterium]|nr:hypothetical protein [Planctomycetales bacterium]